MYKILIKFFIKIFKQGIFFRGTTISLI